MDVGEHDGADAFYLDDDVEVLTDALYITGVSFEDAVRDAYMVTWVEVLTGEYLAACGVVGGKESQQID